MTNVGADTCVSLWSFVFGAASNAGSVSAFGVSVAVTPLLAMAMLQW
jgi:hypothetical protein